VGTLRAFVKQKKNAEKEDKDKKKGGDTKAK